LAISGRAQLDEAVTDQLLTCCATKVEPYVIAADVYATPPHVGRGGWTWYTGSAGWMQRAGVESILGLHVRGEDPVPGAVGARAGRHESTFTAAKSVLLMYPRNVPATVLS
jgi:hypothetical protein